MGFKQHVEEMDFEDLVTLWNEYASDKNPDNYIFDNIESFAELSGEDGLELARKVFFGDVNSWNDRVYLNGYANLQSCYSVESSPIELDDLAEWLEDEDHEVFTAWKDSNPTFAEWLRDSYSRSDLIAMWKEYMDEEDAEDFDVEVLAESIEECEGDEYLDYRKEILE